MSLLCASFNALGWIMWDLKTVCYMNTLIWVKWNKRLSTLLDRKLFLCRAMDWFFGQTLHGWLKSIFFMTWFTVWPFFLNKKCKKICGRNGSIKKLMPYMDSPHSTSTNFFSLCEKNVFGNKPYVSHAHQNHEISIAHISKTCKSSQANG